MATYFKKYKIILYFMIPLFYKKVIMNVQKVENLINLISTLSPEEVEFLKSRLNFNVNNFSQSNKGCNK